MHWHGAAREKTMECVFKNKLEWEYPIMYGTQIDKVQRFDVFAVVSLFLKCLCNINVLFCFALSLFADIIWVLGRERDLTATSRAQLYSLLYELNINPDRLILTKHEKCIDFFWNLLRKTVRKNKSSIHMLVNIAVSKIWIIVLDSLIVLLLLYYGFINTTLQ